MSNYMRLAEQLQNIIPDYTLDHYAQQQRLTSIGVCGMFVMKNSDWAERLFNDNSLFSLSDIIHDFAGLMIEDEHFVSRI